MINLKHRVHFWRIFWVVVALNILSVILGVIALSMMPISRQTDTMATFTNWKTIVKGIVSVLFTTTFFYYALNYYYRLITLRRPFYNYLPFSLLLLVVCFGYDYATSYFLDIKSQKTEILTPALLFFSFTLMSLFYIGMAVIGSYFIYLRDDRKRRKVLEEQKMQLEVEKSQANYNFLKAQINPHFLHNTLNFLYAKSLPYSEELSEGILTLSDIMRYALSAGMGKDGRALLKDEIAHLRNVIRINQLRFSNNLNVQLEVNGVVNDLSIIPFVLITLVENAFKHGDLKDAEYPIIIRISIKGNRLDFFCRNKKKNGPKEISTGIGMVNIKKQLELNYGTHHQLNIKDDGQFYEASLIIDPL